MSSLRLGDSAEMSDSRLGYSAEMSDFRPGDSAKMSLSNSRLGDSGLARAMPRPQGRVQQDYLL